ncbi:inner centromere protein A-like [Saccostrea echinata]|uniref:inner centromere protein A-like n=1 Tax=Saccostrea echinata TaxID=191078 RepID=UPI002A80B373|nr:inner centromere protein A-like [Saccostrea echinata]
MEELLKNETVKKKIKGLSIEIRKAFIESLLDLFEQETEDMIDAIEESRMELRGTMLDFEDETEQLRAESRMLEQRRIEYEKQAVDKYLEKKGRKSQGSRASSRISIVNERDDARSRAAVVDYIRKKKDRTGSSLSVHSNPSIHSPNNERPVSVISSRSLPTPVMSQKTIEEETDLIMKNMAAADHQMEYQRHRHAEMLEKRRQERAVKKKTTEEKALELLEKALLVDKQLAAKKEIQNRKLQERLDEMKRKKERDAATSRATSRADDLGHTNEAFEDLEKY